MKPKDVRRSTKDYTGESTGLALRQFEDLIGLQIRHGANLDNKSSLLFAIASGVSAITVPLVLSELSGTDSFPFRTELAWLVVVSVLLYMHSAIWFWQAYKLQIYRIPNDPNIVSQIVKLPNQSAQAYLCASVDHCFNQNLKIAHRKSFRFRWLARAVIVQTAYTIGHSLAVGLFTLLA